MFDRIRRMFSDRRKRHEPVAVERRKASKVTRAAAEQRLAESIDRFERTVVQYRDELTK
jgi:hypothetical protein